MTEEEKAPYKDSASIARAQFKTEHPDYCYENCRKKKKIAQLREENAKSNENNQNSSLPESDLSNPSQFLIWVGTQLLLGNFDYVQSNQVDQTSIFNPEHTLIPARQDNDIQSETSFS
ncbi:hypothetical protein GPJ56_003500 [Histomonas meleagridis]|uniref:uncharacterized protein n=1 Tax=Histomonas meleagridis TaxID=135588 RepID=UPI003559D7A0|nr:hypothetical protein GPJ56_003500 [Histomonas meleagridis]KAH0799192.1 hypothetical protein GO595_007989 [Histomonas meleagridis]